MRACSSKQALLLLLKMYDNEKTILLGWLPPAMENVPSPCLSVLKPALNQVGYNVSLKYWNVSLNPLLKSFFNMENLIYDTELNKLMPFY